MNFIVKIKHIIYIYVVNEFWFIYPRITTIFYIISFTIKNIPISKSTVSSVCASAYVLICMWFSFNVFILYIYFLIIVFEHNIVLAGLLNILLNCFLWWFVAKLFIELSKSVELTAKHIVWMQCNVIFCTSWQHCQ